MKKINLLLLATLFAGGLAAQTVTYSYTVSETVAKDTPTATTGGTITFGADKFETANNVLAYKLDGDISATSTKYVLVEPTAAFKAGDIIKVGGFCTSSAGSAGLAIFAARVDGATAVATYTLTNKNTTEYLTYTVQATDAIVGTKQLYIFRDAKSSYFLSVEITSAPASKDDATLADLTVNGNTVEGFHADSLNYTIELPYGTTEIPVVAATASSDKATVVVTQAATVDGTATVVVTAEDGTTTRTYTISFTLPAAQSTDATLKSLNIDGKAIADFRADSLDYTHVIAFTATAIPEISAEVNDASASLVISQAEAVPGTATVVVTAQAGNQQTYTVAISRAKAIKHLTEVPFSNGAKGAINETELTVTVPYMAETEAPTAVAPFSVIGDTTDILQPSAVLDADGKTILLIGIDKDTVVYTIVTIPLTPVAMGEDSVLNVTFTGEEAYIYGAYGWDAAKGWKFAKKVDEEGNMRNAKGNTRIYMALPAASQVSLTSGTGGARAVEIYVNGVKSSISETAAAGASITLTLNDSTTNFIAIESNQMKGDGGFTAMQLVAPATTEEPNEPENPDQPENPDEPENPDQPENPDEPENPDQPENPDEPENPDQPENPDEPENPDQPENPEEGLTDTAISKPATKVIRNGQMLIIREGKTYTVQGVEVE
ncbi:MAG: cadherin-like beta sandwich domain-containing protein [Paludibacteraceae bacterium]